MSAMCCLAIAETHEALAQCFEPDISRGARSQREYSENTFRRWKAERHAIFSIPPPNINFHNYISQYEYVCQFHVFLSNAKVLPRAYDAIDDVAELLMANY
jgi:hypothetical protein